MKNLDNYDQFSVQEKWYIMSMVANLYYNKNLTQDEIAKRIYTSRSKVSRLLKEAKELGIVEIRIQELWERSLNYEERLKEEFDIKYIRVVQIDSQDIEKSLERLGEVTAYYVDSMIDDHMTVGISFGSTLYHVVKHIYHKEKKNISITVIPIMGAMRLAQPECDSIDLTKNLALAYGGDYKYLPAPFFVKNEMLQESLLQEKDIREVLDLAREADMILTSVGNVPECIWSEALEPEIWNRLSEKGAVGSIGGHIYDMEGREVDDTLKHRTIGLNLQEFRNNQNVVCIAHGEQKAKAVLGGLRGGYINTLIIDQTCAKEMIRLMEQNE
ncbi:MAG: sugar-binding transcriptional regulator [Eubacteriales bacterium]|nr:sugar-binding transcriptional regulator [Eubacteriales bacterium]